MPLASIVAKITADKTGFDAALKGANKSLDGLKGQIAGAFSTAAVLSFAKSTIDAVSRIADLSEELGVSAEALQVLEYGAKQTGTNVEAIAGAFKALAKARQEALQDPNSKSGQALFGAIGLKKEELQSQTIEETFRRIASVVNSTDFGASELAIVQELLGRSGAELIPMMKSGLDGFTEEAKNLGLIISDSVVSEIDKAGDAIDRLITRLRVPMANAIEFVANRLKDVVDFLDMGFGGIGAAIGAATEGNNPFIAVADHVDSILQKRIDEEVAKQIGKEAPDKAVDVRKKQEFNFAGKAAPAIAKAQQIQSDQFQRIGAFTGQAAAQSQLELARRNLTAIERIKEAITQKGILIRGTD